MDESKAALLGGALTGALVGLKADLATGGLTLGGGLLAGGLLGALGAAGLARCVNLVRGTDRSWLAWNAEALDTMLEAALLRYLAVAHFGRGRGEWAQAEAPPHWKPVVEAALSAEAEALAALWERRDDDARGRAVGAAVAADHRPRVARGAGAAVSGLAGAAIRGAASALLDRRPIAQRVALRASELGSCRDDKGLMLDKDTHPMNRADTSLPRGNDVARRRL